MKKVIIAINSTNVGGAELSAMDLASELSNRGYEVFLISTYLKGNISWPTCSYSFIYLKKEISYRGYTIVEYILKVLWIRRFTILHKPDYVISFLTNVNILMFFALIGQKIPIYMSDRSNAKIYPSNKLMRFFRNFIYKFSNALIVQTCCSKEYFISRRIDNVVVIPNFIIDKTHVANTSPKFDFKNGINYILNVGRLEPVKRQYLLIEVFADLLKDFSNLELIIIGNGSLYNCYESLIRNKELNSKVHLLGEILSLTEFYEKSNFFVLSSSFEGFPNVLLESLNCGLPVVSMDVDCGPREIVVNNINGILVPNISTKLELKESLKSLMEDEVKLKYLSTNAKSSVEKFQKKIIIDRWISLFV